MAFLTKQDLSILTIPQLKQHCRDFGLPVSGTKTVLVDRLLATSIDNDNLSTLLSSQIERVKLDKDLIYESTAIKMLGLTRKRFRSLDIKPFVDDVKNPHYSTAPSCKLYRHCDILDLVNDDAVVKLRTKPPMSRSEAVEANAKTYF